MRFSRLPSPLRPAVLWLPVLFGLIFASPVHAAAPQVAPVREQLSLDRGWRFHLGDASAPARDFGYGSGAAFAKAGEAVGAARPDFNDSTWRTVNVPHDWAVELDFVHVNDEDVMQHGFKPVGRQFPASTIGWYRRSFILPEKDRDRRISVRFDGVFRDCIVWLNGHFIGRNLSGYGEFSFDITDYATFGGKNVLVVRVNAEQYEGWFYEGAGIYRHTWLIKHAPLHIPEYGVFVVPTVRGGAGIVDAATDVRNDGPTARSCVVRSIIRDRKGRVVAEVTGGKVTVMPGDTVTVRQRLRVASPEHWSLETPHLHTLRSLVLDRGSVVDSLETSFGIRTIHFDKDRGFFLNGVPVKIKGVCCHQDHAGVGSALPDRLQYYRIERLKEMGCNAYRASHNPPTRELLDACDRLGMLVMDENRLMGSSPELITGWETLIRRDRNRPSVILWSLGNEEFRIQSNDVGRRIAESLVGRLLRLDPTRQYTFAANNGNKFEGINSVMPVRGFNYMTITDIDTYRKDHPDQILIGSEEASTVCTRGIYASDTARGYVCDYDSVAPRWGSLAERWWKFFAARPWLAGAFVWTGFDYRGEPTPYGWPCINSHFGIMDVCGFPKNNYYYYQSWWSDRDVLHLFPHWNWKSGQTIAVWVHSNCDSVELFLNGRSLGRRTVATNEHLSWSVPYEPGSLEAKGWRSGRRLASRRETTGNAVRLALAADRDSIGADAEDVAAVRVMAFDAGGREVPVAGNHVRFLLSGPGAIIGVGNGDPSSHEPDKCAPDAWARRLFNGKCQVIIQAGATSGAMTLQATSEGLQGASLVVEAVPAQHRRRVD